MTDFNSYTTHFGHHCSGKDNLVTGGSNWPFIGLTYTSCFIRLGSRTDRFQGDSDLLQTCKMGMYYISLLILWMLLLRGTDRSQPEKIRVSHFDWWIHF
jgi:hypothetical protein